MLHYLDQHFYLQGFLIIIPKIKFKDEFSSSTLIKGRFACK